MLPLTRLFRLFGVCLSLLGYIPAVSAIDNMPAQAYIRAGEHGQALLMNRLGECYAITPAHVIGGDMFATLVGGKGNASQGDGDLLQTFGYDLSILHLTGALSRHCGGSLTHVPNLNNRLTKNSTAKISSVNADGSLSRRAVTINDVGLLYVRVRPDSREDQLFKGLSGSLLLVNDEPAGILMSLNPESGEGKVLRYDRAIETLRPFFGMSAARAATTEPTVQQRSTARHQVSIVSWSSPPLDATSRTINLTDAIDSKTAWYAKADSFPIELVIELPGMKSQVVKSILLVGDGVEPKQRLPRDFEILVSNSERGNWMPVISGTYFMNDTDKLVSFMPMRARQVMLRFYSNWGDKDAIGLSGLEVPLVK